MANESLLDETVPANSMSLRNRSPMELLQRSRWTFFLNHSPSI